MIVEVESNDNCETGLFARFKEVRPARAILQVRLYERNPAGEWFRVTGWRDDRDDPLCQAFAQLVEDSGSGFAYLVYGGMYGLRFKSATSDEHWSLADPTQWGEAYLLLGSEQDLIYAA